MSFDVSALAAHTVVDPEGNPQVLGELWKDRPHAILFLRHFG